MTRVPLAVLCMAVALALWPGHADAARKASAPARKTAKAGKPAKTGKAQRIAAGAVAATAAVTAAVVPPARPHDKAGEAEARLIEVYRLVGQGRTREALARSEALVRDHPNFQLAQLVHGDLLSAHTRPVRTIGDVPDTAARAGAAQLAELREESALRLKALRERPPPGTVPSQFLHLSARSRHAIAVDTSRARLYLFENSAAGLRLAGDYYISVGKSGVEKAAEGDLRTPLGLYYITSNLDPKSLKDFYGTGALPINYPNPYDVRRGKTGSGIWLHGTPPTQFARTPRSTDGCVVLANEDLNRLLRTVEPRTTPVLIAPSLQWSTPAALAPEQRAFSDALQGWRRTKASGDMSALLGFYTPDFNGAGKTLAEWKPVLKDELARARGRDIELKDLSYLRWTDAADTMVVTFGEVVSGRTTGVTKRQYWIRHSGHWKIFFEGVIG